MRSLPITAYCCNCAKDNDRILTRALASVNWCSQKIFISDKSKETSKNIARQFGWEIFEWLGPNHMSARRNYAVGYKDGIWDNHHIMSGDSPIIKNDLILQIDSDEVYEWDSYINMKAMIEKEPWRDYQTFAFKLASVTPSGEEMGALPLDRMWQKGIYWEKSIQNNPMYDDSKSIFVIPVKIYHYGYGDNTIHQKKQWSRLPANEIEALKDPNNIQSLMYLLNCLAISGSGQPNAMDRIMGTWDAISKVYDKSPKTILEKHALEKSLRFLWCACMDPNQKLYYINSAQKYYEDTKAHPDTIYRLHEAYMVVGDFKKSIVMGEKFLQALNKFDPLKGGSVMELTTGKDAMQVKHDIVGMCREILKNEPGEKMYEKKIKYWSKK